MSLIKLGILKETKTPPDKRVPLTPEQCEQVMQKFPEVKIYVERSDVRSYKDEEYSDMGIALVDKGSDCDILIAIKEVNIEALIPNKKYIFFSHTFKEQAYNRELLQAILEKKIQLIDYEMLIDKNGHRIIGFGKYAGIIGCYNAFLAYGKKHALYTLKPAHLCDDRAEIEGQLKFIQLPKVTKIVLTGFGRVGKGAREMVKLIGIKEVAPNSFLTKAYDEPVFTQLNAEDYYAKSDGTTLDVEAFYANPKHSISTFNRYLKVANLYIPCHYWDSKALKIVTQKNLQASDCKTTVIADISCDIADPIASTLRPSTNPHYGYDPATGQEVDLMNLLAIGVVAVDSLLCELPKDASQEFGQELIEKIFPHLFGADPDNIILRASETDLNGNLMPDYSYLSDFVAIKGIRN